MISTPDATPTPTIQGEPGGAGDEQFRWDWFVSRTLHPAQVAVIEAFLWIGLQLSPSELAEVLRGHWSLSLVGYHTVALAKIGVLRLVDEVGVRGATKHVYVLSPEVLCR